ncbi:hypothetical protein HYV71_04660 [Candidatus Uhrbacteria bacterium]|nr:hypothetical protein [Candidatus Uhrbacteria bacterium]
MIRFASIATSGLAALFFALFAPLQLFALGISPSELILDKLPSDFEYNATITVSRGNPAVSVDADVVLTGPAVQYITLPKGTKIVLEKGVQQTSIPIVISTKSLAAGVYEGTITVTEKPSVSEEQEAGVSILATGATSKIKFTVVDEKIENYLIEKIAIGESEEGGVIGFSFYLSNKGNISARPTKIVLSFYDIITKEIVYTEEIAASTLTPIGPFHDEWVNVKTGASLPVGKYRITADFYKGEELIGSLTQPFQVFPPGTLAQKGVLLSLEPDKETYDSSESVKINGVFKNTGEIGVIPELTVEIFKDDKRIEQLVANGSFVPQGVQTGFSLFFQPKDGGSYRAQGYATYGPFKTDTIEFTFTVKSPFLIIAITIAVLSVLLAFIAWLIVKRKRKSQPFNQQASP